VLEHERRSPEDLVPEQRPAPPIRIEAMRELSSAVGNQAFARLAREQRMLGRTIWEWGGRTWRYKSGEKNTPRPAHRGSFKGEEFDDEAEAMDAEQPQQEPRVAKRRGEAKEKKGASKRRRTDQAEDEQEPSLETWLESNAKQPSEYPSSQQPRTVFHSIVKDNKQLACFEWALRGNSGRGPSPDEFWIWLAGLSKNKPDWVKTAGQDVQRELQAMIRKIAREGLVQWKTGIPLTSRKDQRAAKEVITRAATVLATQCGFTVVDDASAAGWVVCNYRVAQGAGFPDHWWLELRSSTGEPLVLQTVSGNERIEVGPKHLRWHTDESARGRNTEIEEHDMVRIPVTALLPSQIAILQQGMRDEIS
jgi:hypothetical protein